MLLLRLGGLARGTFAVHTAAGRTLAFQFRTGSQSASFAFARHLSSSATPQTTVVAVEEAAVNEKALKAPSLLSTYSQLAKAKLSALVVSSTVAGYGVATAGMPFDLTTLGVLTTGTFLGAASAAGFNQWMEVANDRRMARTMRRPLPMGHISASHAFAVSAAAGVGGVAMLAAMVNPLTAALCASTIGIYTLIYTPMKQKHYLNTWVGAIVGAIPPVMGFTAVTGSITLGSIVMGALLFSWQLPHFLALSYMYRDDYVRGGYQMLGSLDAKHTANVILRHCCYLLPITVLAPVVGITDWYFAAEGVIASAGFAVMAIRFRQKTTTKNARRVFLTSLLFLPVVLILMVVHRTQPVASSFVCPHEAVQVESLAKHSNDSTDEKKSQQQEE